jgi:hypothetical protein
MKKLYVLAAFALFSLTVLSQPVLHWRFANPTVFNNGTNDVLQFDVELSCTDAGTFHSSMQIFFDYSTLGFGTSIVANNKISYTRLALMQGQFSGTDKYNVVNTADNTDHTFAILTEAAILIPDATFMNEVPQLPAWSGFFQFQIIIADMAQVAGIVFRADRMDSGNYYVDATHPTETKYGIPPGYAGVYENDLLNYQLFNAGTLTGSVTDLSANPIAGATVTAGAFSTTTLADGSYSMLVTSGTYDVTASAACHDPVTVTGVVMTLGSTIVENFTLPGDVNGTLSGTVTDLITLLPLGGVTVTAGTFSTTTLADGSYTLGGVTPGTYDVVFSLATYLDYTVTGLPVPCNYITTVNMQLCPQANTGTLTGTVTDLLSSMPLGGVLVETGMYSTTTAADGSYSLLLPSGNCNVTASLAGYVSMTQPVVIPALGTAVLDFALTPDINGTLSAYVYDYLTLAPVANATVTAGSSSGLTDASGMCVMPVLNGTYTVTVTHPAYQTKTIPGVVITGYLTTNLSVPMIQANPAEPVVFWKFNNPHIINCDTLQFDVELKCSQAGTYHSSTQVYWVYNTQAFGTSIVGNGKVVFEKLDLLSGIFSGQPKYTINNIADNNDSTFAILFEPSFLIPGSTFMNEVTTSYQPFGRFKVKIQDPTKLAGIYFLATNAGVGIMDGGQYYVDATHPDETKYGLPPHYAGVYDNDLIGQSLQCSATFVWTGAVSSDWFTPGNWNSNAVPGAGDDAEIPPVDAPFPIIIGGSASVSSLTVYAGANLVIDPTGALTTNGLLTNDGVFTINSDGTGAAGSFIDLGGFAGTGLYQFNRDMLGTGNPPILTYQGPGIPPLVQITDFHGWHLISPPIDGMSNWDIFDYWINSWNVGTQLWQDYAPGANYPCITGADNPWNAMIGYSVKRDISYEPYCNTLNPGTGNVIEFENNVPFHSGPYTATVDAGWNLLGNPYPSPIDPNTVVFPGYMNGSVYYYDDVTLNYVSWAGGVGPNIPATQGFFVSGTGVGPFGVTNANRTHAGADLYYKEAVTDLLELKVAGNNSSDITYIRFLDDATTGFDRLWDAYKIRSEVPEVPTMYTRGGADLSINSMPATDQVPVYFSSGADGYFIISAVTDLGTVYLEDKEEGIFHNLSTPYEFFYTSGSRADRFVVHFNLSDELANNGFAIYAYAHSIYVNNLNNVKGSITVYTMMGQEVDRVGLEPGLNILNVKQQNATYIVKVSGSTATVSEKVYTW